MLLVYTFSHDLYIKMYKSLTVVAAVTCRGDQFQCPNDGPLGQCYPPHYACDGDEDCDDGYDEQNCTIGKN